MKNLIDLNINEILDTFKIHKGKLYRTRGRFKGEITSQHPRCGDQRTTYARLYFAVENKRSPTLEVYKNDGGNYAEVQARVSMIIKYNRYSKVYYRDDRSLHYVARYITKTGQRLSKSFKDRTEANKWRIDNLNREWLSTFQELDLVSYLT